MIKSSPKKNVKVLVFLHYFGGSKKSWKWVINLLENDYECIALNLPGFGYSSALKEPSIENFAEYVHEELEKLEIETYIIVAHSMGAKIAFLIAANDLNKKVEQLILIAPSPPGIEPIEAKEKRRMLHHPDLEEASRTVKNITKVKLTEEQHNLVVENNLIVDNNTWNWWLNEGMNHSIENKAKNLKLPVTILTSEDDPVMTPKIIKERVLKVFPEAQLLTTKNTGHLIPIENPEWVVKQIRSLLSQ